MAMIRKRYILTPLVVIIAIIIVCALGYKLFLSKNNISEVVFAATEIGTPQGDKVTKEIGSAGGTLASPDGRLTLTVPPNALTETIPFSIQPITNKADGGLGLGYRLEPSGRTFTVPLELSVRYDEKDIAGTIPEALSLAYQDQQGNWHSQDVATLDQNAKRFTVTTTHFTDWSFLSRSRISPDTATLRVGETLRMQITPCYVRDNSLWTRFLKLLGGVARCEVTDKKYYWDILPNWFADIGTIDNPRELHIVYTAPPKKPTPNVATVTIPYELEARGEVYEPPHRGVFSAHITIIDRSYRVSGNAGGDTVMSGVACDLEKPFTVTTSNPFIAPVEFTPSSANGGSWKFATKGGVLGGGHGDYTIDGEQTSIQMSGTSKGTAAGVTLFGGGNVHLTLTPLTGNECGGG